MAKIALNTRRFGIVVILVAILILATAVCSACTANEPPDGGIPGENPQWLNQVIQQLNNEPVANPPASVTQYDYEGQIVYYVPPQYADIWSTLYGPVGDIIGHPDGGISGNGDGRAKDFLQERKNGILIWADEREYDSDMIKAIAPVESIKVIVAESYPPQYIAVVTSGLLNSCMRYGGYYINRNGDTIHIEMVNWKPADPDTQCEEVYTEIQKNIPLGSDFESGTTYIVEVNGNTVTFLAQ